MKSPITKIKNLFNNYAVYERVTAAEYNGNITALKAAIEHNGEVLKDHETVMQNFLDNQIPVESIGTDKIEDKAITYEKLSEELVDDSKLLTPNYTTAIFKNLLNSLHKTNPNLTGTFINGSITHPKLELIQECDYSSTVEHAESTVYHNKQPATNTAAAETYEVNVETPYINENGAYKSWEFSSSWVTTYDLGKAYNISCANKNNFKFIWVAYGGRVYTSNNGAGGVNSIEFLDASKKTIANTWDIFETTVDTFRVHPQCFHRTTVTFKETPGKTLEGVRYIKIKTSVWASTEYHRGYATWGSEYSPQKPSLSIALDNATSVAHTATFNIPAAGTSNKLQITARIKSETNWDSTGYPAMNFFVLCYGECKNAVAGLGPALNKFPNNYFRATKDMSIEYEGIVDGKHTYFITQDFEAPIIISALLKGDKCYTNTYGCNPTFGDLNIEDTIDGKWFDFPDAPFIRDIELENGSDISGHADPIYPEDAEKTVNTIKDVIEKYNEIMDDAEADASCKAKVSLAKSKYTSLSVGEALINIRFTTSSTNLFVDSICVTKLTNEDIAFDRITTHDEGADE